jgi:hypothetical protein
MEINAPSVSGLNAGHGMLDGGELVPVVDADAEADWSLAPAG